VARRCPDRARLARLEGSALDDALNGFAYELDARDDIHATRATAATGADDRPRPDRRGAAMTASRLAPAIRPLHAGTGKAVEAEAEPRMLLSDFLRHQLGRDRTHVGCEHGVCGACTRRLDGMLTRACLTLAVQVDGCDLRKVEGLAPRRTGSARCNAPSAATTRFSAASAPPHPDVARPLSEPHPRRPRRRSAISERPSVPLHRLHPDHPGGARSRPAATPTEEPQMLDARQQLRCQRSRDPRHCVVRWDLRSTYRWWYETISCALVARSTRLWLKREIPSLVCWAATLGGATLH